MYPNSTITISPRAYRSLALVLHRRADHHHSLVSELDSNCLYSQCFCFILYPTVVSGGEHVDEIIGAAVADGKVTPKVQSLVKILLKYQYTEDFRAIIFVERVVSALVLPKVGYFTKYFSRLGTFSLSYFNMWHHIHFAGLCRASVSKFYKKCKLDWSQQ